LQEDPAAEDIGATGDREDGFRITSRTRAWLVKATFAIAATSMPGADSSTVCARRHVTTGPLPGR
jgi:hypothetical protein